MNLAKMVWTKYDGRFAREMIQIRIFVPHFGCGGIEKNESECYYRFS